jgi:MFS family permease
MSRLSKWSILLGNLLEHYDTALFSLLSPFLAPLFFPRHDSLTALILTYAIIPLGMIARPLGSLVIGYIGDTWGRKEALALSLIGMAIVTGCMTFLPVYQQVGILAPLLLSVGRIFQNFFAAGEVMGGAVYLMENSSDTQQDWMSGLYNASTVAGILLASFGVSLLCLFDHVQTYWRLLYLFGCSTALVACVLRVNLHFKSSVQSHDFSTSFKRSLRACWEMKEAFLTIAVAAGFSYASYTMALVMINGLVPLISPLTMDEMMHLNTVMLLIDFLLLPLFGLLARRFSREKMMIFAAGLAVLSGFPLMWTLQGALLPVVILVRLCLVLIGVCFSAPFYAWSQTLVPVSCRYTVLSLAYAMGSQLIGGHTATLSLWLFQKTHWIASVAGYWMGLGLLSSILIAKQKAFTVKELIKPPFFVSKESI